MSGAYLRTGEFNISTRGAAAAATAIVPVVTCVGRDPVNAGSCIVSFGYERSAGSPTVSIPYATGGARTNYVNVGGNPLPPRYGVPTDFVLGSQHNQFTVRALDTQDITWWLTSDQTRSVVATSRTLPMCAAGQIPQR